jgi:hypothetical protein
MQRDQYMPVRMNEDGRSRVEAVAEQEFEGNRSAALRRLLALGLAAWQQGHRTPDTIKKAAR